MSPIDSFFVEIISPLTDNSSFYVNNSAHIVERTNNAPIHSNQMESQDVVTLFIKVHTDESLVVQDKLAADLLLEKGTSIPIDNLIGILTFSVETTYFVMESDIYREEGIAVVTPLLQVVTNIYMEYLKKWH